MNRRHTRNRKSSNSSRSDSVRCSRAYEKRGWVTGNVLFIGVKGVYREG